MYSQLQVAELLQPVELKEVLTNVNDTVDIIGMGAEKLTSTVTGVEMFRKILDQR